MKLIRYSRFQELEAWIEENKQDSLGADEPICMLLEGQTGIGKSTLLKAYAKAHPSRLEGHRTIVPVFYMQTPSPVSTKALASEMLNQLGDPAAHKGSLWQMNSRLIKYLNDCDVELVMLDDFHHLFDKKKNSILHDVADWLKVLIKKSNTPFLIAGIDGHIQRILDANSQLSRLFVDQELKPFAWDERDIQTIRDFAAFMAFVELTLGIKIEDDVPKQEMLWRIHFATNGVMGYLMYLLRKAMSISKQIDLVILADAYEKRLRRHIGRPNPFIAPPDQAFVAPEFGYTHDDPHGTTRRGGRRKKRQPKVGDVLRT